MEARNWRVRATLLAGLNVFVTLIVVACGGSAGQPTAIPADRVRPEQPTPVFADATPLPIVATLTPNVAATAAATLSSLGGDAAASPTSAPRLDPITARLATPRPPTALGIATGGATLLDAPAGGFVQSLPAGTTVTVTGRSADGSYLAAYTGEAVAGWVATGNLRLFADDGLVVVEQSQGPGPLATMVAEAMEPIEIDDLDLTVDLDAGVDDLLTPAP